MTALFCYEMGFCYFLAYKEWLTYPVYERIFERIKRMQLKKPIGIVIAIVLILLTLNLIYPIILLIQLVKK
jgi:hypothetical protein